MDELERDRDRAGGLETGGGRERKRDGIESARESDMWARKRRYREGRASAVGSREPERGRERGKS